VAAASGTSHLATVLPATSAAIAPGRYQWDAAVTDGTDRYSVGTGTLTVAPDLGAAARAATLTTGTEAANNGLTWTAATAGTAGNAITLTLIDPGAPSAALSVTATTSAVRVSLATGSGGALTSTATAVAAAVAAWPAAAALVAATNTGASTGAGIVTALAATHLSGGTDAATSYDGRSHARRMLAAIEAMMEGRATDGDLDVVKTSVGGRATDFDLPTLVKMRQQYAAAVAMEDDAAAIAAGGRSRRLVQTRFYG
jgi:hypothetical protein